MGFPGIIPGFSWDYPWAFLGLSSGFPGIILGFSWNYPWVFLGLSLGFPGIIIQMGGVVGTASHPANTYSLSTYIHNNLHTYLHVYIHTYIQLRYIQTLLSTYIYYSLPTYIHAHILTYLLTYIQTSIHSSSIFDEARVITIIFIIMIMVSIAGV